MNLYDESKVCIANVGTLQIHTNVFFTDKSRQEDYPFITSSAFMLMMYKPIYWYNPHRGPMGLRMWRPELHTKIMPIKNVFYSLWPDTTFFSFPRTSNWLILKPLDIFWTEQKLKFTDLQITCTQGLQKVMVKDFSWNIIPWNAFWENIKTI